MLARGFTMICLVVAFLGMIAAVFVAKSDNARWLLQAGGSVSCPGDLMCSN